MDNSMSISTISLDAQPRIWSRHESRRTWRNIFRITSLVLLGVTVIICIWLCCEVARESELELLASPLGALIMAINTIKSSVVKMTTELNQVTFTTSIILPNKVDQFGQNVVSQVAQLVKQCNAVCRGHQDTPELEQFINQKNPTWILQPNYTTKLTNLHEIDSIIPLVDYPGFSKSCTRFPSFSEGSKFWCFTYAVVKEPCSDISSSIQVVKYGAIKANHSDGNPYLVLGTKVLDDGKFRRGCSITSSLYGCYLLCSTANVSEVNDYAHTPAYPLTLELISKDGITTDLSPTYTVQLDKWSALYPGIGSGVIFKGYLMFPVYGGLPFKSPLISASWVGPGNKWPVDFSCSEDQYSTFNFSNPYSALYSPHFSNNIVVSALFVCPLNENLPYSCEVQVLPQGNLTIGAEGRLYVIDQDLYYYQRSTSWWPYLQLYKLNIRITNRVFRVRSLSLLPIKSTTRPGYGNCTYFKLCPHICVTGVYQSPWLISIRDKRPHEEKNILYFIGWSPDEQIRQNPLVSLCHETACFINRSLATNKTHAGYSESHCVQSFERNKLTCTVFYELTAKPWAEMRVQSLLFQVDFL
ncbi:attachment protein [Achimota virus 2]|uniref:Attachment protein n=1 Tax=Achimota virus 2 TaxID=1261101 RepID=K7XBE1_9MONO|nr:attachment protein [Achimota virus 2]AFX75117.1 attachment protein [Achimota virus 2]